jgi:hypothetical protein
MGCLKSEPHPDLLGKESTYWVRGRLRPYTNLRVETWIEKYRTSMVHMGHKLVDPSKGTVIATAKVVSDLHLANGTHRHLRPNS